MLFIARPHEPGRAPAGVAAFRGPLSRATALAVRPGLTDPSAITYLDEAALLVGPADPEQVYIERILPTKLRLQADYAARATFLSDIGVLLRTLLALLRRRTP